MTSQRAKEKGRDESRKDGPKSVVAMLMPDQQDFRQALDVVIVGFVMPKQHPNYMRVEESILYAVGVPVGVDVPVMVFVL